MSPTDEARRPGDLAVHRDSGTVVALVRRKDDDSGWWVEGGGGLADSVLRGGDWTLVSRSAAERALGGDMEGVNLEDVEDCHRCYRINELCGYHQGEGAGGSQMKALILRAIEDDEWLWGALAERDRKRAEAAERRPVPPGGDA